MQNCLRSPPDIVVCCKWYFFLLLIGKEIEARLGGGLLFDLLRSHSHAPTALSLNS